MLGQLDFGRKIGKKMKKILVVLSVLLLNGCSDQIIEDANFKNTVPAGLADCKLFKNADPMSSTIKIVRCPNSTTNTTYRVGKTTNSTVVIDGVEYIRNE